MLSSTQYPSVYCFLHNHKANLLTVSCGTYNNSAQKVSRVKCKARRAIDVTLKYHKVGSFTFLIPISEFSRILPSKWHKQLENAV